MKVMGSGPSGESWGELNSVYEHEVQTKKKTFRRNSGDGLETQGG